MAGGIETAAEMAAPTEAATWVVNTTDDPSSWDTSDDILSLREAIGNAETGDTIAFDDSLAGETIVLGGSQLKISKGITIDASSIGGMTIDADEQSRVFYISGGDETTPVELIGLTITGGNEEASGGGVYNYYGTLTITDSAIEGNTAGYRAGGICNNNGTLTLTNSTVAGNTAEYRGGGIYNYFSTLTLINSAVAGNTANDDGGGIYNYNGTLAFTNSAVSGNTAKYYGGGIDNYGSSAALTLTDCTVAENTAENRGGGIYNYCGTLTFTNSAVVGNAVNDSNSYGGGIDNNGSSAVLTLTNCIVAENTAKYRGGGIRNYDGGAVTLTNSAVVGNTADGSNSYGGGIDNYGSSAVLTLTNCTVAGNTAKYGGGVYIYDSDSLAAAYFYNTIAAQNTASSSGNDVYGPSGSLYAYNTLSSFTDWTESSNCLDYDSALPLFTDAAVGDYTLAEYSQAINRGNNSYILGYDTDLAGNPRIVNGIVDLGAYEFGGSSPILKPPMITTGNFGVYVSYGANRHQIQWKAVSNASGYELAYSTDGSSWTTVSTADTAAVVTGLTYGQDVRYRVRALGTGAYTNSDWSTVKVFNVCPMDVDGDGDVTGGDRVILVESWLSNEEEDEFVPAADINGDGDVTGADRSFLVSNWLLNVEDDADGLVYPPAMCADAVFDEFASADLDAGLDLF